MLNSNDRTGKNIGSVASNELSIEDFLDHQSTSFEVIGRYNKEGKSKEITIHYGILANTYCVTSLHHDTQEFDNIILAFDYYNSL